MTARSGQALKRSLFATAILAVLSGHWAAETVWHWVLHEPGHDPAWPIGIGAITLFLTCTTIVYRFRAAFGRPESRVPHDAVPPRLPVLLWFLSLPGADATADGIPPWFSPTGDLDADLDQLHKLKQPGRPTWSSEMLLRAARYHGAELRAVVLIASAKSAPLAHHVCGLLARYPVFKGVRVVAAVRHPNDRTDLVEVPADGLREDQGWDFENFEKLTGGVLGAVASLNRTGVPGAPGLGRVDDDDIMVDFTGGQKVTSVVAAAATFDRPIRAEYVSTHYPYPVRGYDLVMGSPAAGGHGLGH
ncbi:MAG TPA: hypothetical protein VH092_22160 [Urbifossiella sp.]|jgi:hypothetical protein|nr:hypothetical protein [Urbifossiella sp.]